MSSRKTSDVRYTSWWLRWLPGMVILLAGIGVCISVVRTVDMVERPHTKLVDDDAPARLEHEGVLLVGTMARIEPGTEDHLQLQMQFREFLSVFDEHPITTLLHVIPSALFAVLILLQFSGRVRQTTPSVHRWSGRLTVLLAIPMGLTGIFFGVFVPFGGRWEAIAIALWGFWFFISLFMGVREIRRRNIRNHRKWMLRMVSVALGVIVVRVFAAPLAFITQKGLAEWFDLAIWLGFLTSTITTELWIRNTAFRSESHVSTSNLQLASQIDGNS